MIRAVNNHFSAEQLPMMTRPSYRRELVGFMTMPWAMALLEGGVAGVLANKVFDAGPQLIALITAAPMIANLTSFLWAHLARGRSKIAVLVGLWVALLALLVVVATLPATRFGGWLLAAVVVVARCLFAGVLTMRSTIWRQNYPRHLRGRITGRLGQVATLFNVVAMLIASLLLRSDPDNFRFLYPVGALIASVGVVAVSKVRVRGERLLRRYELRPGAQPTPHGSGSPIYEYDPKADEFSIWSVLRDDRRFRWYMVWQFFAGVANMMSIPVVIYILSDAAELDQGFVISIGLSSVVPMLTASLSMPLWGHLLDRMHIASFRVKQAGTWIAMMLLLWMGAMFAVRGYVVAGLVFIALGRVANGLSMGAGILAWQLGHNDFASRHMVSLYMGVHQVLTGIRGVFAPFLGMWLYTGWSVLKLGDATLIPAFAGIGPWVFMVTFALSMIGSLGFWSLSRSIGHNDALDGD